MKPWSVSKINCFESCPMKYKLSYIDKVEQEHMSFFKKGSKVHYVFENLSIINDLRKDTTTEMQEALKIADNFLNTEVGVKHLQEIKNATKEFKIGLKIENNTIVQCDYYDKECLFRGIIDLLNKNHILDYKTGRSKSYNQQDWTQLTWYAIWLFLTTDYNEIDITYMYVEHNKENTKTLYRKDLKDLIISMLKRIKLVTDYNENPTETYNACWQCEYCPVRKSCKKYNEKTELETIDFETI